MALGDNFTVTRPDFGRNPINFFKEVYSELLKVNWPKRKELIQLTCVVIGVSVAIGIYLGGLDYIFTKLIGFILSKR